MMAKKLLKMKFSYSMLWLVKTPTAAIQYFAPAGYLYLHFYHRAKPDGYSKGDQ
jgi:hypothetical protein